MSDDADVAAEAEVPAPPTPTPPPPSKIVSPSVSLHASISPSIQPSIRSFLLLLPLLLFHVCISLRCVTNAGRVSLTHSRWDSRDHTSMCNAQVRPWHLHGCGAHTAAMADHASFHTCPPRLPSLDDCGAETNGWQLEEVGPQEPAACLTRVRRCLGCGMANTRRRCWVQGRRQLASRNCVRGQRAPSPFTIHMSCMHLSPPDRTPWACGSSFCTHVAFHHCCVTSCARFTTDN
jgi:hypothetical protein